MYTLFFVMAGIGPQKMQSIFWVILVRHRVLKQVQNDKKHFTITIYSSQMPNPIAAYAAMTILL